MNGYMAIYRNKRIDVQANTSYEAQKLAAATFRAKHSYDVAVWLCEVDSKPIVHKECEA